MKRYIIICVCALGLVACNGNGNKNIDTAKTASKDTAYNKNLSAHAQNMEYCFISTDGLHHEDTTAIHLVVNGAKVKGDMKWLPKEKDARNGSLNGTVDGNNIKALWTFMQEGTKDTIAVEFKLSAQQLLQKPYTVNNDGRQITDKSAGYTIIYKIDNCERFITPVKPAL